ncbi:hypothetical protein, partial [Cryobacterium sp. M91]|uniref:hypothetical protein n=1 Tax=Cryobacterium sp. M91 TaxID=2048294 RepID=UPI0011B097E4
MDPSAFEEPAQGVVNGAGIDVSVGTVGISDTGSSGESDDATGSGGGSAGSQVRPAMCVSHKSTTEPSQWVPCNTGGLSDIVERHPQLLPTIAAPPAACPLCSAETIIHISDLQNFPAPIAPTGM